MKLSPPTPPNPAQGFGPAPSPFTQSQLTAESGRKRRRRKLLSGGLALVVLAGGAIGVGLLWPSGQSNDEDDAPPSPGGIYQPSTVAKPKGLEGRVAFPVYTPELPGPEKMMELPGTWAKGKTFAKTVPRGIDGYKGGSSEPAWQIKTPKDVCGASRELTEDGKGVILYRDKDPDPKWKDRTPPCNHMGVFDIDTGKPVWDTKFPSAPDLEANPFDKNLSVAISDGVVAIPWGKGSIAYDIDTQKKLWQNGAANDCRDQAYAGGAGFLALVHCGSYEDHSPYVQKIDPRSGKRDWSYSLADGVDYAWVMSVDPPVISVAAGDAVPTNVITLDDQGEMKSSISLPTDRYVPSCVDIGLMTPCRTAPVIGDRLYLPTAPDIKSGENSIIEFDLATGKSLRKYDSKADRPVFPLRRDGQNLMVFNAGADPSKLFSIGVTVNSIEVLNLDDGKTSRYMILPHVIEGQFLTDPRNSDVIFEGGRVYFSAAAAHVPEKDGIQNTWYAAAYDTRE